MTFDSSHPCGPCGCSSAPDAAAVNRDDKSYRCKVYPHSHGWVGCRVTIRKNSVCSCADTTSCRAWIGSGTGSRTEHGFPVVASRNNGWYCTRTLVSPRAANTTTFAAVSSSNEDVAEVIGGSVIQGRLCCTQRPFVAPERCHRSRRVLVVVVPPRTGSVSLLVVVVVTNTTLLSVAV